MKCNSYGRMLKRISTLSPYEQATVKRIFSWLICTRRPLRTVELSHALLIQPGDKRLQHIRALYKDILELCGPIVEKRKEYITFIHFSAKEYSHTKTFSTYNVELRSPRFLTKDLQDGWIGIRKAECHAEVAVACLSYLSFRYFDGDITDDEIDGFAGSGEYALHGYSRSNFLHHIRGAWRGMEGTSGNLKASTKEFLKARWNPSFRRIVSKPSPSSSELGHIKSMDPEDYGKLITIAAHLRTRNFTESSKGLFLLYTKVTDC